MRESTNAQHRIGNSEAGSCTLSICNSTGHLYLCCLAQTAVVLVRHILNLVNQRACAGKDIKRYGLRHVTTVADC